MQDFRNILFVSHGNAHEVDALKQALSLARNNKASLSVLLVCPDLSGVPENYRKDLCGALTEKLAVSLERARGETGVDEKTVPVPIDMEAGKALGIQVIRRILVAGHDIVIKAPESADAGKGFRAMDMELLRKCPCPVWMARPIDLPRGEISVGVAIDPQSDEPAGHDLSLRLLRLSRALADTGDGTLNVLSCWNFEHEEYLRNNPWAKMAEDKIVGLIETERTTHRRMLDTMIAESGVSGDINVGHLGGRPEIALPAAVEEKKIDILVMGTVARTGIPGFIIGNTAENILQKIGCSLVALKPNGFVSPVKAY